MAIMTLDEILAQLEALGDEKVRSRNIQCGASANQVGFQLGDIRKLGVEQDESRPGPRALGVPASFRIHVAPSVAMISTSRIRLVTSVSAAPGAAASGPEGKSYSASGPLRLTAPKPTG